MPKNDDSSDNEDFWDRPRKTRKEDKQRSSRRKKKSDEGAASSSPLAGEAPVTPGRSGPPTAATPPVPPAAPPAPRMPKAPPTPPVQTPPFEPPARRRAFDKIAPPRPPASGGGARPTRRNPAVPGTPPPGSSAGPARPTTSPRVASRRAAEQLTPSGGPSAPQPGQAPGVRYGRPSGETPDLTVRLEGLASRGRLSLAPPGTQRSSAPPATAPEYADPLSDIPPGTYTDSYGEAYSDSYTDEYELDDEAESPKQGRGCLRVIVAFVLVVALLFGAVGWWIRGKIDPGGALGDKVLIEVVQGESTSDIGETLESEGVISSATVWTWYVRLKGGGSIQAGSYELRENMSMGEALAALEKDPLPPGVSRVTIPPGFTYRQTLARLTDPERGVPGFTAAELDAALADPAMKLPIIPPDVPILEGTLFPDTYDVGEGITEAQFVKRMVDRANETFSEVGLEAGAAAIGKSPYEVLIVASLIEEEIKVDEERPILARLIYNRLATPMALGIDATSCYGIAETPCNLSDDNPNNGILDPNSEYDTRNREGLPRTPISSPSRASIEAALHPADGPWIYSVVDPAIDPSGNRHLFTASYEEFQAAKQRCAEAGLGCG